MKQPTPPRFPVTSLRLLCLLLVPLGFVAMALSLSRSFFVPSYVLSGCLHGVPRCRSVDTDDGGVRRGAESTREPEFRLLVGVMTTPRRYERRAILRLAYALQPPAEAARVDVRFVLCDVTDAADAVLVAMEAARHGDIVVLDCAENMNDGKTHAYLAAVSRLFAPAPYDYVMKADDDTYLRVAALADELRSQPRSDLYLGRGYAVGDDDPAPFMHGMGYVVSWDVAAWLSANDEILRRNDTHGHEDRLVGKWLNAGGRGKNRYNLKPRMYDINWDMDEFRHNTIAVHRLKDNHRWAAVLRHFNATAGIIKPSILQDHS
ncbi:beta-1,3-galactosyltransferase pvg3-like [Oryza brachyantha]|uniref:Hexosyltransferase n=1 Tax=Oryza brachyantha TaxID=4533 RepID=J3MXQ6_ORYBR|nr:beta-1,3-galactosyltransferase pvg3-like [Oryza brachyantha]